MPIRNPQSAIRNGQHPELTAKQLDEVRRLGKLGTEISVHHLALILDLPAERMRAWAATAAGRTILDRARAVGRAEYLSALFENAKQGDSGAQRLYATFLERDETARLADLRISAAELAALMGKSRATIGHHVPTGDFVAPGAGGKYSLGELLGVFPKLWARLAECRDELARLRAATAAHRQDTDEARRLMAVEAARRARRENDTADGLLVPRVQAEEELRKLCDAVRIHVAEFVQDVCLPLGLEPTQAARVEAAGRKFLTRCAEEMVETN